MKASPIIINWHSKNAPIYSAEFQPHGKGRLATAGGDNHIRLWKLEAGGEDVKVDYICTLSKHTQAVNVVRWAPKGDLLASASDDGNVITWILDTRVSKPVFGEDDVEDKECWRTKTMVRTSGGSEVYDLAWSPDGIYYMTGSMDNVVRIYNAQTGQIVRQVAEHQHYIQGVAWDPLNEYIATQSSDRSVHIYTLKTKEGTYTLDSRDDPEKGLGRIGFNLKMDLPSRRISSHSPILPDTGCRSHVLHSKDLTTGDTMNTPGPSCPGTPTSQILTMNPPSTISHSRRSSIGAASPALSFRRSASPASSFPLPAVMPRDVSPKPYIIGMGARNANIYANETLKSFFRRLTFTPDGSLLLTPAGQYQNQFKSTDEGAKITNEVINTVYIYTRGGINKPPIAHLPGQEKPSIVVKCSPVFYTPREITITTKHLTMDTSSADTNMTSLPEPISITPKVATNSVMEPPPRVSSTAESSASMSTPKQLAVETHVSPMAFSLPYRIVFAVATEDAVLLYDTQQRTPICIVSNLHCATFTDLAWSNDGSILLMTSSDGFCSTLSFTQGELGDKYTGDIPNHKSFHHPYHHTPMATPTVMTPSSPFSTSNHRIAVSSPPLRPYNRARSSSVCSVVSNPPLVQSSMPGISASNCSSSVTPGNDSDRTRENSVARAKRAANEGVSDSSLTTNTKSKKQRRIAPTPITEAQPDVTPQPQT
ncbi:hypothetical protein K3495_g1264 [Podosphaera aphanis]|nr:hypothetical protein K3495_g1264 [Podosphaera aphanis]